MLLCVLAGFFDVLAVLASPYSFPALASTDPSTDSIKHARPGKTFIYEIGAWAHSELLASYQRFASDMLEGMHSVAIAILIFYWAHLP